MIRASRPFFIYALTAASRCFPAYAQNARAMEEAQAKISALEEELKTLQAEHRAQHEQKSLISRVLMEAQIHAQELRDETQAQEEQLRGQLQEQARMQKAELEEYAEKLSRLRASFQILLENMDNQAEKLEQQVEELAEAVPTPGSRLPLFPNKTGTED